MAIAVIAATAVLDGSNKHGEALLGGHTNVKCKILLDKSFFNRPRFAKMVHQAFGTAH